MSDFSGPAGLALQMFGTVLGGIEANRGAKATAGALEEKGRRTVLQGELDAQEIRREERAATGEMLAAQGASGLVMGTGSLADMIAQNAYAREVDIFNVRTAAVGDANALNAEAAETRRRGRAALTQSLFNAASGALTGAADMKARKDMRDHQLGGGMSLTRQRKPGERRQPWEAGGIVVSPGVRVPPMRVIGGY